MFVNGNFGYIKFFSFHVLLFIMGRRISLVLARPSPLIGIGIEKNVM